VRFLCPPEITLVTISPASQAGRASSPA
jgi:hypothetical protein